MTALGVVLRPQLPPERLASVARAADEAGLDQLWLWEDSFYQGGITSASAALAMTRRLRVGIGVVPVPYRNVALMAMETATLERMFPGRFILGVGHGAQGWMAQAGVRVESPLTLLREYLDALRAILRGERVSTTGRYVNLDGVQLHWPLDAAPPVLVGARGPKSLRLSGEAADGTAIDGTTPPDGVRRLYGLIEEGRVKAGRADRHQVVVYLLAATGPDAKRRLETELDKWATISGTRFGAAGEADTIAAAIAELAEAGADTVVLVPPADEGDLEAFVRFTAEKVSAALRTNS